MKRSALRRRPEFLLMLMAGAVPFSFEVWRTLLNNFAVGQIGITGDLMGVLQSLREVPGFLTFTAVFILLILKEQRFAVVSLATLGLGTALTGFFPTVYGLYFTTILMSTGYHYFEAMQTSLSLQWLEKERAPLILGRLIAVGSFVGLTTYAAIYFASEIWQIEFRHLYLIGGVVTMAIAVFCMFYFPWFESPTPQHKHIVLRKRYGLYYALTFMAGARRQIFVVFAGFMMVEKFGYAVEDMALLFLVNGALTIFLAPQIGKLIGRWGERRALTLEYIGLIGIFVGYAFVTDGRVAAGLYILDHVFFAMAIAIKTYFQKIADPADIAATASVGFSISHIAAVVIPAVFGLIWMVNPSAVFLAGAGMTGVSLILSRFVPDRPEPGYELQRPGQKAVLPAGE